MFMCSYLKNTFHSLKITKIMRVFIKFEKSELAPSYMNITPYQAPSRVITPRRQLTLADSLFLDRILKCSLLSTNGHMSMDLQLFAMYDPHIKFVVRIHLKMHGKEQVYMDGILYKNYTWSRIFYDETRSAALSFLLYSRKLPIVKDVAKIIARLVYNSHNDWK